MNDNSENLIKKHFFPNLVKAWILVLCLIPSMIISAIVSGILTFANVDKDIISLIIYIISVGILVAIAFFWKNKSGDNPLVHYKNKVSVWIYIMLIPAIFGLSLCVDAVGTIILPDIPTEFKEAMEQMMSFSLPAIFTVAVAAPILEEIFCRGIICEGLIKNISPRAGILWSAFIFAVIHLNPWQGFSAFAIGCFLGWIYWKTRSLLPCIFIHFVNNSASVYAYHYYTDNLGYDYDATIADIYGINQVLVIAIGSAIFLLSFWMIRKKLKAVE
jgi:membrane protease YdiL (CAAX protease family)